MRIGGFAGHPLPMNGMAVARTVQACAHVGVQRQSRHVADDVGDDLTGDDGLRARRQVRLNDPVGERAGHLTAGVSDVDLAARYVKPAAFERQRLGQPGDSVLRGGVGDRPRSRYLGEHRTVVDDAAASRSLVSISVNASRARGRSR